MPGAHPNRPGLMIRERGQERGVKKVEGLDDTFINRRSLFCFRLPAPSNLLAQMLAQNKNGVSRLSQPLDFLGAGTGGRTPGLLITNQLLYH